jgi:hypothetical protein
MNDGKNIENKICEICGKSISLAYYVLHTAQCNKLNSNPEDPNKYYYNINQICENNISDSPLRNNPDIYKHFPSIVKNQMSPDTNFRLLSSFKNNELKSDDLGGDKINVNNFNSKNSFMLINNENYNNLFSNNLKSDSFNATKFENTYNEIANPNIIKFEENEKENDNEIYKIPDEKICHKCLKTFTNNITYELHVRRCTSEEDQLWDNFENNNLNQDYYSNEDYNSGDDGHSDVDYNDSNLNYEDLIRLDEEVVHPLSRTYISMLGEESLTQSLFSKLNDENKKCMICFDDFEVSQKFIRLPCLHMFHSSEITKWFQRNKTCPVCRLDVERMLKNLINN